MRCEQLAHLLPMSFAITSSCGAKAAAEHGLPAPRAAALRRLSALTEIMNPAVGDALSGILAVEARSVPLVHHRSAPAPAPALPLPASFVHLLLLIL